MALNKNIMRLAGRRGHARIKINVFKMAFRFGPQNYRFASYFTSRQWALQDTPCFLALRELNADFRLLLRFSNSKCSKSRHKFSNSSRTSNASLRSHFPTLNFFSMRLRSVTEELPTISEHVLFARRPGHHPAAKNKSKYKQVRARESLTKMNNRNVWRRWIKPRRGGIMKPKFAEKHD